MKKLIIFTFISFHTVLLFAQVDDKQVKEEIHNEVFNLGLEDFVNMEITVATKKAEKVSDAPAMITVHSKQDIVNYGYYTLSDLANITSGYGMSPIIFGEKGFETRGQASSAFENDKHLILIDGIPVNFARSYKAPIDYELPIFFTKRVEFLKGPASALYGVSAFYGIVHLVSDDLQDNGIQVKGKMSFGSLDFNHRIMINTIIKNDKGQTKFSFSYYSKDTPNDVAYHFDTLQSTLVPNFNFKNFDQQQSFFMNFSHQLTHGSLNGLSLGTIYMYRKTALGVSWDPVQSTPANNQNWVTIIPYLKYDKQLSPKLSIYSYAKLNVSNDKGTFFSFSQKDSTQNQVASDFLRRTQSIELLVEAKYKASKKMNFILGFNFDTRGQIGESSSYDNFLFTNDTLSNRLQQQFSPYQEIQTTIKTLSPYGQMQYKIGFLQGLMLTAGLRYDYGVISNDEHYQQLSPRLGLVQKLTDKISLKLLYGKALRSPTPKAIGLNQEAKQTIKKENIDFVIKDVQAETIESFEAGLSFNNRKIGASVAIFSNVTKNSLEKQQENIQSNVINYYQNVNGFINASGMEIDAYVSPISRLKIMTNYSFAKAQTIEKKEINFMPTHKINGAINYTLYGKHKLSMTIINRNVLGIHGDKSVYKKPYSLIDLNVRFPLSNNISIETQVRNLLNKEYFVSANGASLYVKQASRNFLFTLSVNY